MVQKSGGHQLRLVVYRSIFEKGFLHIPGGDRRISEPSFTESQQDKMLLVGFHPPSFQLPTLVNIRTIGILLGKDSAKTVWQQSFVWNRFPTKPWGTVTTIFSMPSGKPNNDQLNRVVSMFRPTNQRVTFQPKNFPSEARWGWSWS